MNGSTKVSEAKRDAMAERLLNASLGMFDVFGAYLGDRLGLYRALGDGGPATSRALADRAGCHERYVREWLEQQAVGGVLDVADASAEASARVYALPAEHAEVLLDRDSLNYMAPIVRLIVGAVSPLSAILDAYRTGGGVPYADYGNDLREGQAEMNRPMFLRLLPDEWLPAMTDVHARLRQQDPPARVADLGCGAGWSSIAIARGYPNALVDGFDLDHASVELAQMNLAEAGVTGRVSFEVRDAGDPAHAGAYDLVTIFEALHDMSDPVGALRAARQLLAPGGALFVVDENVAESFTAPAGDIERLMYGWSIVHCLPAGMADQPSAGTGAVMRPDTVRRFATEAGFSGVDVLPVEHPFFRFYRLTP
jgi:2-polyprenyl-3-methyl-5-hydroxy-6-metoxy-1,4-benzoquinol methylase